MRLSLKRIQHFFGLDRNVLVMTLGRSLRGLGSGMWDPYMSKVLEALGASAPMIGTFGTINRGLSTLYSYLGGAMSDRLGRGKALILSAAIAMIGYFIYAVSPLWWLFIPGTVLLTASAHFDFMGSLALYGEAVKGGQRATSMAASRLISLPFALVAPPLGGLLIVSLGVVPGFRVGVILTIALTVAGILAQKRLYRLPPPAAKRMSIDLRAAWRAMSLPLRSMLIANGLMAFGAGISTMFVILYAMNELGATAVQFGLLQSVLIGSTSLLSIPFSKLADRKTGLGRKPYVAMAFLLVAINPVLLVLAPSPAWLWPIFMLKGIRETFDTVRKAMVVDLAGEGERGRVIGLYFFVQNLAGFPSAFIGGLLWQVDPKAPFLVGASICMLGFIAFLFVNPKKTTRHAPAPQG